MKTKFEKWMPPNEYRNLNQMRYEFEMERNGLRLRKLMVAGCSFLLILIFMITFVFFIMEVYFATLIGAAIFGFIYCLLNWFIINYNDLRQIIKEVEALQ